MVAVVNVVLLQRMGDTWDWWCRISTHMFVGVERGGGRTSRHGRSPPQNLLYHRAQKGKLLPVGPLGTSALQHSVDLALETGLPLGVVAHGQDVALDRRPD